MRKIYFYTPEQYLEYKNEKLRSGLEIYTMSQLANNHYIENLEPETNYIVDISSVSSLIHANDAQIFNLEQLFHLFSDNITFIADKKYKDNILYDLRYIFDESEDIFSDIHPVTGEANIVQKGVRRIIDLTDEELEEFFISFNAKLYGHERFKNEFKELVSSFLVFNKIGEHKVLSFFLMGDSGVGKTEVARCIHKCLGSNSKMAKIHFGNYSSHDALNSLIGSPLGYIGSDGGELVKRIIQSDVGLILIDEFEKADTPVFNYFLDVLENGKIVNSQAEEYDVNGYIIVFTSNISKSNFMQRISPELRSRFDYKGVFNLLTDEDKLKFVQYRVNEIIAKYKKFVSDNIDSKLHSQIVSEIEVSKYKNMRDLNKKIKDTFVRQISINHNK